MKPLPIFLNVIAFLYQNILKRLLFLRDPEKIHNMMTAIGEMLGKRKLTRKTIESLLRVQHPSLTQTIAGITFENPIGLSAGFDYEARLTQIHPAVGFGFQTVGTITNHPYDGNVRPMLGRLPKSKSLMVNKGFKNLGAATTAANLSGLTFQTPVGISIGRTNSLSLKTQVQSIEDIIQSFTTFEQSSVKHSYYELNISCPNLYGDITFYPKKNLQELLTEVDKLQIKKPIFIKMPIEKSNEDILEMLETISNYSPTGVIFGNLQKDRTNETLNQEELRKFPMGNFSGKPTYLRSNELIRLCYKNYKSRLTIIGCGGVFNAQDAYMKIALGASLVQLITGMIYQGPQLIAQINIGLVEQLKQDGFTHVSQVTGIYND